MPDVTEPGLLIAKTIDEIITRISKAQPLRSDGTGLTSGFVVSRLAQGVMIDPDDFRGPWTPAGGATLQDAVKAYTTEAAVAPTGPPPGGGPGSPAGPAVNGGDPKFRRAFQAAFNTAALVDTMIKMTADERFEGYPTERKVSFAYEVLLGSMNPVPAPPMPEETRRRLDEAMTLLYERDTDGSVIGRSARFKRYQKLAEEVAKAKAEMGRVYDLTVAAGGNWPSVGQPYQQAYENVYAEWRVAGLDKVEAALATVESIGVPMQEVMIGKARKLWEAYNIPLTSLPVKTAYSFVFPSGWADPDSDDDGWTKLSLSAGEYNSHRATVGGSSYWQNWQNSGSATGGGGGGMIFGFGFRASGGSSTYASSDAAGSNAWQSHTFQNDAKNLTVELEYGVVTVQRPWLVSDLFYFRNWYNANERKLAVSNGLADPATNADRLLPLVPKQFLVVRNLKVRSSQWNSDGAYFQSAYSTAQAAAGGDGSYVSGSAGFCLGPVAIGGSASRSSYSNHRSASGSSGFESRSDYGFRFQNGELEQRGAQIVAWFSEVVPASAPLDDPGLPPQ